MIKCYQGEEGAVVMAKVANFDGFCHTIGKKDETENYFVI